jgi:hypothetical protein
MVVLQVAVPMLDPADGVLDDAAHAVIEEQFTMSRPGSASTVGGHQMGTQLINIVVPPHAHGQQQIAVQIGGQVSMPRLYCTRIALAHLVCAIVLRQFLRVRCRK